MSSDTESTRVMPPWWATMVGYEVYIRSFADSNGSGVGDLAGLRSRLSHFVDLGVDLVWITPFYPSPMADFGYDVEDYCDVDPLFGTLDDFDATLAAAHDLGLRVLIDLVPNHTSDRHRWFQQALADPASPERDYYIFRDPGPTGGPPNNWVSHFGGPAWTLDPRSGQYYLHLFLPEQPDLNWSNPAVREEFDRILRFWFDRGIDGLRIDVAHALVKDQQLRDNPVLASPGPADSPRQVFDSFRHAYDLDQEGVRHLYQRWRRIASDYEAMLLGEVYLDDAAAVGRYVRGDGLDLAFFFPLVHQGWDARGLRDVLAAGVRHLGGAVAWPISSHDDHRAASRFGGGERGSLRSLSVTTLVALLPGVPFLYQGDELGLEDGRVPKGAAADPLATRNDNPADGRDGVRTPYPWKPGNGLGFTTGTPWITSGDRTDRETLAWQREHPDSPFVRHQELLTVRRALVAGLDSNVEWNDDPEIVMFRRGSVTVAANLGGEPWEFTTTDMIAFHTGGARSTGLSVILEPDHAVVVAAPQP